MSNHTSRMRLRLGDLEHPAYTTAEVAELAGLTYRQVDYWTRRGYLSASLSGEPRGSGWNRYYSDADVETARKLKDVARIQGWLADGSIWQRVKDGQIVVTPDD